jgi:hypothetical protein
VSATLAAAGFHRTPLDDEDDPGTGSRHSKAFGSADVQMRSTSALALATTSSSFPSAGGRTSGYQDDAEVYNPYVDYDAGAGPKDAHGLSRPYTPPSTAFAEHYRNLSSPEHATGHSASHSGGSYEPLLASFKQPSPASPASSAAYVQPPTPPPRNPKRLTDSRPTTATSAPAPEIRRHSSASSIYSSESTSGDERLDPDLRNSDIRDDQDYSRRVLGVRSLSFTVILYSMRHCRFETSQMV